MIRERIRKKCRECDKVREHGTYFETRGNTLRTIGRCVECDRKRGEKWRQAKAEKKTKIDAAKKPKTIKVAKSKKPPQPETKAAPKRDDELDSTPTKNEKISPPEEQFRGEAAEARDQPIDANASAKALFSRQTRLALLAPTSLDSPPRQLLEGMLEVLKENESDLTCQITEDAVIKTLTYVLANILDTTDRSMAVRYLAEAKTKAGRLPALRAEQERRIAEAKGQRAPASATG